MNGMRSWPASLLSPLSLISSVPIRNPNFAIKGYPHTALGQRPMARHLVLHGLMTTVVEA
jgi:hypothetical protein